MFADYGDKRNWGFCFKVLKSACSNCTRAVVLVRTLCDHVPWILWMMTRWNVSQKPQVGVVIESKRQTDPVLHFQNQKGDFTKSTCFAFSHNSKFHFEQQCTISSSTSIFLWRRVPSVALLKKITSNQHCPGQIDGKGNCQMWWHQRKRLLHSTGLGQH